MSLSKSVLGIHGSIYKKLLELIQDLTELKQGDYRKSSSGGFMDLHLNVLSRNEATKELIISLAHHYTQNGDLMNDPDMEIKVYLFDNWPMAEALTYQQDGLGIYQEVYPEPGKVYPKLKKELNSFLLQWLKNIKAQRHSLKKPYISDGAMHEDRGIDDQWEREI